MLRFGIVSKLDYENCQARVNFKDDESTSFWLPVLQKKTLKDKFYYMPDIGETAVCLMDDKSEDGVILGSIYSSEDKSTNTSNQEISANFDNGSYIKCDKTENTLIFCFSKIKFIGDIEHSGAFANSDGITSNSDITDKKSSMQEIRDVYNPHTHTGNMGNPTSNPNVQM